MRKHDADTAASPCPSSDAPAVRRRKVKKASAVVVATPRVREAWVNTCSPDRPAWRLDRSQHFQPMQGSIAAQYVPRWETMLRGGEEPKYRLPTFEPWRPSERAVSPPRLGPTSGLDLLSRGRRSPTASTVDSVRGSHHCPEPRRLPALTTVAEESQPRAKSASASRSIRGTGTDPDGRPSPAALAATRRKKPPRFGPEAEAKMSLQSRPGWRNIASPQERVEIKSYIHSTQRERRVIDDEMRWDAKFRGGKMPLWDDTVQHL